MINKQYLKSSYNGFYEIDESRIFGDKEGLDVELTTGDRGIFIYKWNDLVLFEVRFNNNLNKVVRMFPIDEKYR